MRLFYLLFSLIIFSCERKTLCQYSEDEHISRLNDSVKYFISQETDNNDEKIYVECDTSKRIGSCYYFKNGKLTKYKYFTSDSTYSYILKLNEIGKITELRGNPLLRYYFNIDKVHDKDRVTLHIIYLQLQNKIKKATIKGADWSKEIHILKDSSKSNELYSSIHLSKHDSKSILKTKYFIEYLNEDCTGKTTTFYDTIKVKEYNK